MRTFKVLSLSILVALTGCNGDDGKNGIDGTSTNGLNSLVAQTSLTVGNSDCINGGIQIVSGLDLDSNATLDVAEITSTEFVCKDALSSVEGAMASITTDNEWFVSGQRSVANAQTLADSIEGISGKAKNVILFVGDGMGISTVTAARILAGQQMGKMGEEHQLSFDKFPYSGFAKTYNVDAQTPDSAGTMTAMVTGVKTDAGVIGVGEGVLRGNCASSKGNELVTSLELAEIAGKSTGIISTARITHATPASTYAKSAERNWEDNTSVAAGCEDIASQLVNFEANVEARFTGVDIDGLEVVMGGGRRHFLPKTSGGKRTDDRDLTTEWQGIYSSPNDSYIIDQTGFDAINVDSAKHVFALFNSSHMQYEADRANDSDFGGEPSLSEMTEKAIDILDNNNKGFFLTVEAGRIDHAHHAGSAYNALTDTIEFANAVQKAVDSVDLTETLIIVTADHSHVFTIAGYPKRGNPILGKVVTIGNTEPAEAADGTPYTTLGYTNGKGFRDLGTETDADGIYDFAAVTGRVDLTSVDTQTSGFHQEALVPLGSETHAGEDVGVYAIGPGAHLVTGTNEQSLIYHVMDYAADLEVAAEAKLP